MDREKLPYLIAAAISLASTIIAVRELRADRHYWSKIGYPDMEGK